MNPAQMEAAATRMYGRRLWKDKLAADLGVNVCTIYRMMHREKLPAVYDVAIAGMVEHKRREEALQKEARKLLPRNFRQKPAGDKR